MTPEAQRTAISKACPTLATETYDYECGWAYQLPDGVYAEFDPVQDMNAAHAMEGTLTPNQVSDYNARLLRIVQSTPDAHFPTVPARIYVWHATAAQRCESFLRTLGLWKEEA